MKNIDRSARLKWIGLLVTCRLQPVKVTNQYASIFFPFTISPQDNHLLMHTLGEG